MDAVLISTTQRATRGPHGRAAIAFAVSVVLVACSLLARWHEAEHAHVVDRAGDVVHAPLTDCHGHSTRTHVHSVPVDQARELGACALTTASLRHAAPTVEPLLLATGTLDLETIVTPIVDDVARSTALLRVAPKTSPPAQA